MGDDLKQMAANVRLEADLIEYLRARKATFTGILGSMATNFAEVDSALIDPLANGVDIDGKKHQVAPEDMPVAKAGIRYLWKLCHDRVQGVTTTTTTPGAPV